MRPNIENFIGCDSSYRAANILHDGKLPVSYTHLTLPTRSAV